MLRASNAAYKPRLRENRPRVRKDTQSGVKSRLSDSDATLLAQSIIAGMVGGAVGFVLLAAIFGAWWA